MLQAFYLSYFCLLIISKVQNLFDNTGDVDDDEITNKEHNDDAKGSTKPVAGQSLDLLCMPEEQQEDDVPEQEEFTLYMKNADRQWGKQ